MIATWATTGLASETPPSGPAEPIAILNGPSAGTSFVQPLGVSVDTTGKLLVIADTGGHRIRIFDQSGYPISSFPHWVDGPRGRELGEPRAIVVDRKGLLYILDSQANYVDVMDLLGNTVSRIVPGMIDPDAVAREGSAASAEAADRFPTALGLDREDHLILAVGASTGRIWGLDSLGAVQWELTGEEEGGGPFGSITGLFIDGRGRIYVTDGSGTPCVRVFSADRRPELAWGIHDAGNENFSYPASVVSTQDGRIWVLDSIRQAVKVFDAQGNYLDMFGGLGRGRGDMIYPSCLATDGSERLYVLERVGARLTTFRVNDLAEAVSP